MDRAANNPLNLNFRTRRASGRAFVRFATMPCAVGHALVAMNDRGVCAILPFALLGGVGHHDRRTLEEPGQRLALHVLCYALTSLWGDESPTP